MQPISTKIFKPRVTTMNKFIYGWMALIILSFGSCVTAFAEEPGSAHIESPDHYELLLENERVLVLKMVLQPGEADLAHHHQNETVYFQKEAHC